MKNVYDSIIEPLVSPDLTTVVPFTLTAYPLNGVTGGGQIQFYYNSKDNLRLFFDGNEWDIFQEVLPIAVEIRRWI